jgi:hypothetical protein
MKRFVSFGLLVDGEGEKPVSGVVSGLLFVRGWVRVESSEAVEMERVAAGE